MDFLTGLYMGFEVFRGYKGMFSLEFLGFLTGIFIPFFVMTFIIFRIMKI